MSNTSWYICLAIICVGITAFAIYSGRHDYKISTLIMLFLFSASITWFGEFIVLGIFDSYAYKPGIASDQWAENLAGHLFLNASMFPAAALLVVVYSLGYTGFTLIIAGFILAEYFFIKLGIYEQHWWRYYMSGINTAFFLLIVKKWFPRINPAKYDISRLLTLYFIGFLLLHTPAPLLLLMGKQHYSLGLVTNVVGNMYRASIIFIFSYHMLETALMMIFVCVLDRWYWKLVPFAVIFVGQSLLAKLDILIIQNGWKLIYTVLAYSSCAAVFMLLEKYTLKPD